MESSVTTSQRTRIINISTILKFLKANAYLIAFLSILIIGLAVRTYQLDGDPAGFFCDEASIGYNAYSILTTGADEFGTPHPLFFKAFGDYKSPIEIYSTVPSVWLFGMNQFSTRLPSAVYGVLSLVAIYLLTKELFKDDPQNRLIAILATLFLAISPWAIHFSRVSLEGLMPFVFFTTFGLYLFLKAQSIPVLLPFSIAAFAFALYSYFPARIFIPLLGIGLVCIYFRFFVAHKNETAVSILILSILLVPFIQNFFSPTGLARWQQINIFSHPPQNQTVLQHIETDYFRHFSADFLFVLGDIDMPGQFITRHSVRGMGELYLFQLPLVLAGLFLLAKKKDKAILPLALWLILYPVGSMFTTDASPQATRSIIGVVPFQILSAVGAVYLLNFAARRKRAFYFGSIGVGSLIVVVSFLSYLSLYFVSYPNYSSDYWGWQYGAKDIVQYFAAHEADYDDQVMASEFNSPEIFFKFYAPHGCANCKVGVPDDSYVSGRRQLFAITPTYMANHTNFHYSTVQTIYYPNGSVAFILVTITT